MPLFTARGFNEASSRGFEQGFQAYLQQAAQQAQQQLQKQAEAAAAEAQRALFEQQQALQDDNQAFTTERDTSQFDREFGLRQMDREDRRREFDVTAGQGDRRLDIAEDESKFNRKLARRKEARDAAIFSRSAELDPILKQKAQLEVESAILQLNNQKNLDKPVGAEMLRSVMDFSKTFGFNLGLQPGITTYRDLREIAAPLLSSLAGPAANLEASREARAAREAEQEKDIIAQALGVGAQSTLSNRDIYETAQRTALADYQRNAEPGDRAPFLRGDEPALRATAQAQAIEAAKVAYGQLRSLQPQMAPEMVAKIASERFLTKVGLPPLAADGSFDTSVLEPAPTLSGGIEYVETPANDGSLSKALGKDGTIAQEFIEAQKRGDSKGMSAAKRKAAQLGSGWKQVGGYILAPTHPNGLEKLTGVDITEGIGGEFGRAVKLKEPLAINYQRFFGNSNKEKSEAQEYLRRAWGELILRNNGQPLEVDTPKLGTVVIPSDFADLRRDQGAFLYVLAKAAKIRVSDSFTLNPF